MSKTKTKQILKLFACCLPVKGCSRSLIVDTQRGNCDFIPNSLFDILTQWENKTIEEIKAVYNDEHHETIDEYFDFLQQKEYIFFTDTPEYFPKMDLQWDEPCKITNAIIDMNASSPVLHWENIIHEFETFSTKYIQIRSFDEMPLSFFDEIMQKCEDKRIVSVELIIKYSPNFDKNLLFEFCQKYPRVSSLYAHSAPMNETVQLSEHDMGNIFFTQDEINAASHCGIISSDYFTINLKTFTEAQKHNTCLNRKISIDSEGYIRNCPSMKEHYGNIRETTLQQALEHPDFKKYWNVHKDQIKICKDCEFRYICTDCRAYVEDPKDMYSKPLKCGYNPYTCEWEEWSTNPLKQKAIDHYNLRHIL